MDLNVSLLIRNQEESHLRRPTGKSSVFFLLLYLLELSQLKLCGLEEPAGSVFINPATYTYYYTLDVVFMYQPDF